jgi:type I restriction enzyme S subunit
VQRRIAAVLGSLDDLIETNGMLVERLARWVHAVVGTVDGDATLGDLASASKPKQVRPSGRVAHYSLPAFDNGASPEVVDGASIQSGKLALYEPCVLVSRLNPRWERCWMVYPGPNSVASTEFVPLTANSGVTPEEVWAVVSASGFWEQMRLHVRGTTGSRQRVDKAEVLTLTVPDTRTLSDAARTSIRTAVVAIQGLRDEMTELARTRDELLPLLMSGRVRVDERLEVAG